MYAVPFFPTLEGIDQWCQHQVVVLSIPDDSGYLSVVTIGHYFPLTPDNFKLRDTSEYSIPQGTFSTYPPKIHPELRKVREKDLYYVKPGKALHDYTVEGDNFIALVQDGSFCSPKHDKPLILHM